MRILVGDLRKGDRVLVSSGSAIRELLILKDPVLRPGNQYGPSYKALKATIVQRDPSYTNETKFLDLNYKDIWLLNRDGE